MKRIEYRTMDKTTWGRGPWDNEPDKVQWQDEATGLPCIARRIPTLGTWCGYVGVPPGHPAHGKHYDDEHFVVHGGLTFAGPCDNGPEDSSVCHRPDPGEPEHVWWLGFDCAHAFDLMPAHESMMREAKRHLMMQVNDEYQDRYRDLAYVTKECASLADQLSKLRKKNPYERKLEI